MYRMPVDNDAYRFPADEPTTNLDSRSSSIIANQATAIRIDDGSIGVRRTWSSDKINKMKANSEFATIDTFVKTYGPLYLSEFEPTKIYTWRNVILDATQAVQEGKPFLIPWNEYTVVEVVDANLDAEEKLVFFYKGKNWAITENGMAPIDDTNGRAKVTMHTTMEWEQMSDYVPEYAEICIYSDRRVVDDVVYPDIKIGDGNTIIISLPFMSDAYHT